MLHGVGQSQGTRTKYGGDRREVSQFLDEQLRNDVAVADQRDGSARLGLKFLLGIDS